MNLNKINEIEEFPPFEWSDFTPEEGIHLLDKFFQRESCEEWINQLNKVFDLDIECGCFEDYIEESCLSYKTIWDELEQAFPLSKKEEFLDYCNDGDPLNLD